MPFLPAGPAVFIYVPTPPCLVDLEGETVVTDVEIKFDVPVPMRDGTILRADVYRPSGRGPWPVLVQRTVR
jgi:predicted acyl esterase